MEGSMATMLFAVVSRKPEEVLHVCGGGRRRRKVVDRAVRATPRLLNEIPSIRRR